MTTERNQQRHNRVWFCIVLVLVILSIIGAYAGEASSFFYAMRWVAGL
jgi:hypothetical protein